jgi:hypothetical protein
MAASAQELSRVSCRGGDSECDFCEHEEVCHCLTYLPTSSLVLTKPVVGYNKQCLRTTNVFISAHHCASRSQQPGLEQSRCDGLKETMQRHGQVSRSGQAAPGPLRWMVRVEDVTLLSKHRRPSCRSRSSHRSHTKEIGIGLSGAPQTRTSHSMTRLGTTLRIDNTSSSSTHHTWIPLNSSQTRIPIHTPSRASYTSTQQTCLGALPTGRAQAVPTPS